MPVAWLEKRVPELLTDDGDLDRETWWATELPKTERQKAPPGDWLVNQASLSAAVGVSRGYLDEALADDRFHRHRIGGPAGIPVTLEQSAAWFGEIRQQEARAAQSEAGRRTGAENLIRWIVR